MNFEEWLAVLTLLVPLSGQLVVSMMLRRDVNRIVEKTDKHEERLDVHDLVVVRIPGGIEAVNSVKAVRR